MNVSLLPRSAFSYYILLGVVVMAGLSQGLLLPLLSILLEQQGVSASVNGFNSASLYIGSFAMTLVAERLVGVVGFKKLLVGGLLMVLIALPLFPLLPGVRTWFVLRLIIGAGDSALNYVAQLWVLLVTPAENRGRNLSLYGMSYGIGFSVGPLGIGLVDYGDSVPFLALALLFLLVLIFVLRFLLAYKPESGKEHTDRGFARFSKVYRYAWFALIPAFLYGYMEASLNGNFPVYGLRIGLFKEDVALLMLSVGIGGLILQLPLGMLSDRFGRRPILIGAGVCGGLLFALVPLAGTSLWLNTILFLAAGGLVGSFYSLGMAYAADLLPKALIPSANVVASFHFSAGSMLGPTIGGAGMQHGSPFLLFLLMGSAYMLFGAFGFFFKGRTAKNV
ncbi:MFS transporter [Saccharibacillus sp. CPCC 101409]|uniref:MFS transporter n=1 Tax=Saccharibacillus sp. CPCC 101409 TaxID=3058041 RepID=UPI002672B483|nr:MFS transporter [Saccharibacillus sp. CPCC 101409]MDO3412865.1 MFS transporter [Saccharibacillus sp. CPCC 101409]